VYESEKIDDFCLVANSISWNSENSATNLFPWWGDWNYCRSLWPLILVKMVKSWIFLSKKLECRNHEKKIIDNEIILLSYVTFSSKSSIIIKLVKSRGIKKCI